MTKPIRFDKMIAYRDAPAVIKLVHRAAREAGIKPSQFIRSAVALSLTMSGFDTRAIPDKDK